MTKPLDEAYFVWLYSQINSPRLKRPSRTYWSLFRILYTKEVFWVIANDDNRLEDGKDLRQEFLDDQGIRGVDPSWKELGCSFLEMLIALSRRLAFEADGKPCDWFWELLGNLRLREQNDRDIMEAEKIDDILERVIWRTYDRLGRGGLFPLQRSRRDQRKVELWYQMQAYLLERG